MSKRVLKEMADSALESGGCIKIDLKAWSETLHMALTGVNNRQTLANFEWLAQMASSRPEPPLLIASTLMVPGYIDAQEVSLIDSIHLLLPWRTIMGLTCPIKP